MRWLLLVALTSCGGKMLVDSDAGDAAITKDASDDAALSADSPNAFPCGEGTHIVYCNIETDYCQLIKTSHSHDYSCHPDPATCTPPASSKYDCGCYQSGAEIYVTICK